MGSTGAKKTVHLRFEGELTVSRASEIREQFMAALGSCQHVEVEFADVTGIDLSCLQLLCSAHRSAVENGKVLTLIKPDKSVFAEAKRTAGFTGDAKCTFDQKNNCLWLEG